MALPCSFSSMGTPGKTLGNAQILVYKPSSCCTCEDAQEFSRARCDAAPNPVSIPWLNLFSSDKIRGRNRKNSSPDAAFPPLSLAPRAGSKLPEQRAHTADLTRKCARFPSTSCAQPALRSPSYISLSSLIAIKDYGEATAQAGRNIRRLLYVDPGGNFPSLLRGAEIGANK